MSAVGSKLTWLRSTKQNCYSLRIYCLWRNLLTWTLLVLAIFPYFFKIQAENAQVEAAIARGAVVVTAEALKMTLMGAIIQDDAKKNVVLLKETKNGKVLAVKPGSKFGSNYEVLEIMADAIVIKQGKKEYLVFKDKFGIRNFSKQKKVSVSSKVQGSGQSYSEPGFQRRDNEVTMTQAYRDNLIKHDLAKVLMQATASPHQVNGKIVGFQLTQIDKGSIYDKGGLQNFDVVTGINGNPLNSVAGAISILQKLKTAKELSLDLQRNGQTQTITLKIQ